MGGVVADEFQRARVVARHDLEPASRVIGSERSVSWPSSAIATAFLASDFEMPSAIAWPVVPVRIRARNRRER